MAEKNALCLYSDGVRELASGDTLAGSGGGSYILANFLAGDFRLDLDNFAEFEKDTGLNDKQPRHLFPVSPESFVNFELIMPPDLANGNTLNFDVYGYAETWVTGKYIDLKLYYSPVDDGGGESWDAGYSNVTLGDTAIETAQDRIKRYRMSISIASSNILALDKVRFKMSRIAAATELSGYWCLTNMLVWRSTS